MRCAMSLALPLLYVSGEDELFSAAGVVRSTPLCNEA